MCVCDGYWTHLHGPCTVVLHLLLPPLLAVLARLRDQIAAVRLQERARAQGSADKSVRLGLGLGTSTRSHRAVQRDSTERSAPFRTPARLQCSRSAAGQEGLAHPAAELGTLGALAARRPLGLRLGPFVRPVEELRAHRVSSR